MENCLFCKNKNLKKCTTEYRYKHDNTFMIFENVPCIKCEFCGEKYFESKVLKKIEKEFLAVQNGKKPLKSISVAVEDFSKLQVA